MKIRVGIPLPSGQMVKHVQDRQIPVLFSANAFFARDADGNAKLRTLRLPPGLDAALDSAGYVALAKYRAYPWTPHQYLDLVQAYPWSWVSSMDFCCEEEVAGDRRSVRMRLAATVNGYWHLNALARDRGCQIPIPILQGRRLEDYLWCAENLPMEGLVGLGSFCRRHIHGTDGIVNLVEQLHKRLPPGVSFHLFGVKGHVLRFLGDHPRVASIDSMAYEMQARTEMRTGRTMAYRLRVMENWLQKNHAIKAERAVIPAASDPVLMMDSQEDEIAEWMDLVANGEIDYHSAMMHMDRLWVGHRHLREQMQQ